LFLWGLAILIQLLLFIGVFKQTNILIFIIHHVEGIAFVIFFFYGTLSLLLTKKESIFISLCYYILLFIIQVYFLIKTQDMAKFYVWNNILFLTPVTVVLSIYFFRYYARLRHKRILYVAVAWLLITALNFVYIGIGKNTHIDYNSVWNALYAVGIIILSGTFYLLVLDELSWNVITSPLHALINQKLVDAISLYYGKDNAPRIIAEVMTAQDIFDLQVVSYTKRMEFVNDLLTKYFAHLFSLQKLDIFRSELLGILNVDVGKLNLDEGQYSSVH
jgi:hypothetical protein